jgi:hypothetical protein
MGKALLIIVIGFSTLFATSTLNMSRHSLESVRNYSNHYENLTARNAATSGVYMSLSRLYRAVMNSTTWTTGFANLTLNNTTLNVDIQDHSEDPNLSNMELRIVSTGTYGDISKSINVHVGVPPDLADLAVFVTDTIIDVTTLNESRVPDPSLVIENAPEMLPFDKDGLAALAIGQNHVINGDFTPPDNWPTNDPTKDFYWVSPTVPNVTHVKGNLTVLGSANIYGIFVVEGNATLNGGARLEGVLYLPNPGTIVIHGGGDPKESSITGGVFANASMNGTGNHITVEYESDYMAIFGQYQLAKNLFIISWVESPDM